MPVNLLDRQYYSKYLFTFCFSGVFYFFTGVWVLWTAPGICDCILYYYYCYYYYWTNVIKVSLS